MDAFKNLIRHGKHARAPAAAASAPVVSSEPGSTSSRTHRQADGASSRQPRDGRERERERERDQRQQQQQHRDQVAAEDQANQAELKAARGDRDRDRKHAGAAIDPADVISPHKEIAEFIVKEEREARSKMPTYVGLEDFELIEKMGDGAFSNVYKALDLRTRKKVAVKVVHKYELSQSQAGNKHLNEKFKKRPRVTERANILKEVSIMRGLNHPSIVKLLSFSESEEHFFLVLELMEGGELFHQIVKLTYFSEPLSRHVILQVAHGIRYLHEERGVVHRDIKPENLLFERIPIKPSANPHARQYDEDKVDEGEFIPGFGGGEIGRVKIADFGLSKIVWAEETATPCGTVGYTAPEIVKDERYSKSVDMWALGCVLYTLLCGFPPFYDESISVLTEKVAKGQYTFLEPWWNEISASAKDLITHLLCVDPAERYTIDEFLAHPWCHESAAPAPPATPAAEAQRLRAQYNMPLDSPLLQSMRAGNGAGRQSPGVATLKEAFDVTYAVHRMEEEGARRRAYNGPGGAGQRGFLAGLNEDDEDEEDAAEQAVVDDVAARRRQIGGGAAVPQAHAGARVPGGNSGASATAAGGRRAAQPTSAAAGRQRRAPAPQTGAGGFELDLGNATLIGRRHRNGGIKPSPLGKGSPVVPTFADSPGSPMRGVEHH